MHFLIVTGLSESDDTASPADHRFSPTATLVGTDAVSLRQSCASIETPDAESPMTLP